MSSQQAPLSGQCRAARSFLEHLSQQLDAPIAVRLWDGTMVPLGRNVRPELVLSISGPGVIGSLLRRPTPDNLLRHYARKQIDFHGADLYSFIDAARVRHSRQKSRRVPKGVLARAVAAFLFTPAESTDVDHCYAGDEVGHHRRAGENKDFIQFHYDISNEFYGLFLEPEMVYSCAYFTDWNNSLEQAQQDKLEMICRKLQLQPGERFLDIGCGWGALVCHAARHYGVQAHGITLSERQLQSAREKVARLGLQKQVTLELRDYQHLEGQWDKIASIGMVEHVGVANMQGYMQKVRSLLPDRGIFLNHGLTRPAKRTQKKFRRMRPERRLLAKYIFPGGELDHIGHMLETMEAAGFEVHDVEGWRDHYAHTCKLWCQRLTDRGDEAIRHVGEERYRMWLLYLAGVSMAIRDGSACIFQTVASNRASKGVSRMPPTRAHLYAGRSESHRKAA
ncbi:MAG: class I SAM-dependent methyltransferase [Planctomycetaceae bacterium]|nr:class I SAM-dependent methyltransferase [Planctomycetaceae bacterium]